MTFLILNICSFCLDSTFWHIFSGYYFHLMQKMCTVNDIVFCFRVKGIKKLRVVDASVMRNNPSGNTNAPTMMIAEKAADLIKHRYY